MGLESFKDDPVKLDESVKCYGNSSHLGPSQDLERHEPEGQEERDDGRGVTPQRVRLDRHHRLSHYQTDSETGSLTGPEVSESSGGTKPCKSDLGG